MFPNLYTSLFVGSLQNRLASVAVLDKSMKIIVVRESCTGRKLGTKKKPHLSMRLVRVREGLAGGAVPYVPHFPVYGLYALVVAVRVDDLDLDGLPAPGSHRIDVLPSALADCVVFAIGHFSSSLLWS